MNNKLYDSKKNNIKPSKQIHNQNQSILFKNSLLKLNGVKDAMTFVQSGNHVTFLYCTLKTNGFQINRSNHYEIPIRIKNHKINTLPDLIVNIFQQFIHIKNKRRIFLAIQSDSYHCEMTYLTVPGKSIQLFKKNLIKALGESYGVINKNMLFDFVRHSSNPNKATVSFTKKRNQIENDFSQLSNSGLQVRYITSLPKILHNIYTYYNLNSKNEFSLLIYVGQLKTHIVFSLGNQMLESCDFPKGLNYFLDNLQEVISSDSKSKDPFKDAIHFLSFYGFEKPVHKPDNNQKLFDDTRPILEHNLIGFIQKIKDSIFHFESSISSDVYNDFIIKKVYISGPGSHIKNIDKEISEAIKLKVEKLSNIIETNLVNKNGSHLSTLRLFTKHNLSRKKGSSETRLTEIKQKIFNLEKSIESNQSPESAKYSIARLDIEKNRKIKSIELANKKLISTSKEFKTLKKEYHKNQNELNSNVESLKEKLDVFSEKLFDQYKEHEEINVRISQLEYESDLQKQKESDKKVSQKINHGNNIKSAAHERALLNDKKENFESEIDQLELQNIKHHELLQKCNLHLSHGYEEVDEFQYLHDSLKSIVSTFKQSFLENLKSVENLTKEDLLTLQQCGFLITKNTKRIDQIRDSFIYAINSNAETIEEKYIDGVKGIEIKEKLLKILELIIIAPENLIHLKNQSDVILKINNDIEKVKIEKEKLENDIKKTKLERREKQQAIVSLKKDIDVQEKDLQDKEIIRLENIDILKYVHDSIEMNDDLEHYENIVKELKPRKQLKKKILQETSLKIKSLDRSIEKNNQEFSELESKRLNYTNIFKENQNDYINQDDLKSQKRIEIINYIDLLDEEEKELSKNISNAEIYIKRLEKKCIDKKEETDKLKNELSPIIEDNKYRKQKILNDFDIRLKQLDIEESLKIAKVKKTKNITIKSFFKKEQENLKKEILINKTRLEKIKKEKERTLLERNSVKESLDKIKKTKLPKIINFKKQIHELEKDLKAGGRIQERLETLDLKRKEQDQQLQAEQLNYDNSVSVLEKTIKRKNSKEYYSFLKSGLDRFDNEGDTDKIAKTMVEESVAMDLDEIEKIENAFKRFKNRHDLFMIRYRKKSKEILIKLKPFGGKKKTIVKKITIATNKMNHEENMVQKWVKKLDLKNEQLIKIVKEFSLVKEETISIIKDRKLQIKSIPEKKRRALDEADRDMLQIPKEIAKEKADIVLEKEEVLHGFDIELANHELTKSVNHGEDKILFYINEIDQSISQINEFKLSLKKLKKDKISLESNLEKTLRDLEKLKLNIGVLEESFNEKEKINKDKIDLNRKAVVDLEVKLKDLKKQKLDILNELQEIEKEHTTSSKYQKDLHRKITEQEKILNINNQNKSKKIRINERRRNLFQFEKDLKINIKRLEQVISEMSRFIDSLQNDQSELESEINLIDNDNELFERDWKRYGKLISDNENHLKRLSIDYHKTLNNFLKIKNLYPSFKIMINERIANIYSIIDMKIKDKDKIQSQLEDVNHTLKNRRIEMAIVDKEISKIHDEMKEALENSFHDSEIQDEDNVWKWEISNSKMKSYMDVAQLKLRSKELYDEIIETEQAIAKLKNDYSSTENILFESDRINLKKIKNMEETCTKLELQITRENNEIDNIIKQVNDLERIPLNQGDRIETLKDELKRFKEKEAEYEITLSDLDRSMETIKEQSDRILKSHRNVNANSISLDYVANLGLLMDPDSNLNILPNVQRIDLQYFRPNQIFQRALLGIVMVFSIGAFANRLEIKPLKNQLPIKQSELSLMDMRKQMQSVVIDKNSAINSFKKYIDNDKYVSSSIVSLLQFISKKLPKDFQVTSLKLNNNDIDIIDTFSDFPYSDININVIGFYEKNLEKSSVKVEKLIKNLEGTGKFKNVSIGKGKKIKKSQTQFSINMVY